MMSHKEKSSDTQTEMIKCSLCGYFFKKGWNTSCEGCPLNYKSCNFEKCPNCGYDIPQGSYLWTLMTRIIDKVKKVGKNGTRP